MKDFFEHIYPNLLGGKERPFNHLRKIVRKARDFIEAEELTELIASMPHRRQAE